MPATANRIELTFEPEDSDPEETEAELQFLISELHQLGLESIDRPAIAAEGIGTRGDGAVTIGTLVIALGSAGATLPALIGLLRHWLRPPRTGTIRLKIGDDELEISPVSEAMRRQVLEDFLRRHEK